MRILFVTGSRIGDAILSSGVLAHLVEANPEARFTVACGPLAAPLFSAVPRLDRIVSMEKRKLGSHWLTLWAAAACQRWSQVVDLRGSAISYLVLARARHVKRPMPGDLHVVEQYARAAALEPVPAPRLWTAPDHWTAAERLVPPGPPVLALAPAANWRGKEWPAHRFVDVARRLVAPGGLLAGGRIAVFGSAADRARVDPVLSGLAAARRIDLVGAPDLLTAHLCLRRCALFIGNDSGTMHLAAASGTPTLGLFGPSREVHYRPWGDHCAVVRTPESYDELIGRPGYDHRTTGTLMGTLSVDAVEAAARALWDRMREGGMTKLSALVVARNEEAQLADCLATVRFADDLVVVLDRSTDGSRAIAEKFGARVIEGGWEIEGPRRHAGIDACTGDWILEVDADERVTSELASEIRAFLPEAAYGHALVPVDNYVGTRLVRHGWGGSWGTSATVRLFAKGAKTWGPQRIHPATTLLGTRYALKAPLNHHVDRNISDMIRRLDRYTTAKAADLRAKGEIGTFGGNLRRVFSRFYKCYVRRKGYREGHYGFLIALFAGLYPLLSHLKARLESE